MPVSDMAASFQAAVVDVLFNKTIQAARESSAREIVVAGGALRQAFQNQAEYKVHIPPLSLCTDNAAMIAAAGYYRFAAGQTTPLDVDIRPSWPLA